jgi:hypothetical protein
VLNNVQQAAAGLQKMGTLLTAPFAPSGWPQQPGDPEQKEERQQRRHRRLRGSGHRRESDDRYQQENDDRDCAIH